MKTFLLAGLMGILFMVLYLVTKETDLDPCAKKDSDIAAAIMSDTQEQEDLVSRALLIRGACDSK